MKTTCIYLNINFCKRNFGLKVVKLGENEKNSTHYVDATVLKTAMLKAKVPKL